MDLCLWCKNERDHVLELKDTRYLGKVQSYFIGTLSKYPRASSSLGMPEDGKVFSCLLEVELDDWVGWFIRAECCGIRGSCSQKGAWKWRGATPGRNCSGSFWKPESMLSCTSLTRRQAPRACGTSPLSLAFLLKEPWWGRDPERLTCRILLGHWPPNWCQKQSVLTLLFPGISWICY